MAFRELPKVDENSKASEESVLAVKGLFSRRKGFISREENPDYGCDLDVEIVNEDSTASSKKFPIQIKSGARFSEVSIEGALYLSKAFPTSRLAYLGNRTPAYGLIVFYDDGNKLCYYEFVEKIIARLNNEKGINNWEENDTVNIHVPKANILSDTATSDIYQIFLSRFNAHDDLLQVHGKEFGIPSFIAKETNREGNLSPLELLRKYGLLMLNDHNVGLLYKLLGSVSNSNVLSSKDLTIIACVVYAEMGLCIEAEYYFKKVETRGWHFEPSEIEMLKFSRIKVDFLLGNRSRREFFEDIKQLSEATTIPNNRLQLQLNLFYYSVADQIEQWKFDESGEDELLQFFFTINQADLSENKRWLLKLHQTEVLHMYATSWMSKKVARLRVRESLNAPVSVDERMYAFAKANSLITFCTKTVLEGLQFGKITADNLIQAYAYYTLGRFFQIKEFNYLTLHFQDDNPDLEDNYKRAVAHSLHAHNLFLEQNMLQECRLSLLTARDLLKLARLVHGMNLGYEDAEMNKLIAAIKGYETEMGIVPDKSPVDNAYQSYLKNKDLGSGDLLKGLSDDEILKHAEIVGEVYRVPIESMINLINEFKAYRLFFQNNKNDRYELLVDQRHLQSQETKYKEPSKYIIRDKITGFESMPTFDAELLMRTFNIID